MEHAIYAPGRLGENITESNTIIGAEWATMTHGMILHPSGVLRKPMLRVATIIGLSKRITPHGLRRTLNTLALQVAPAETIRLIMGHVTSDMTTRYNAPTLDARRDVLARVTASIETPCRVPPSSGDK